MFSHGLLSARSIPRVFPVTIDYSKTLEQMVAEGRYDWKHSDITGENFPVKGEGIVERTLELADYGKGMPSEAMLADIKVRGYRPATIEELLAFGAAYPEKQREFPIIALGSILRVMHRVHNTAALYWGDDGRYLGLYWLEGDWLEGYNFLVVLAGYRFLVVRK